MLDRLSAERPKVYLAAMTFPHAGQAGVVSRMKKGPTLKYLGPQNCLFTFY
jgi:hypothetical protein